MTFKDEILTVGEVAAEMRCSKAHVHNVINGKVAGVSRLPAIHMGRRKLIRRSALEQWKRLNEKGAIDGMIAASPEVDAVRPMGGEAHES
jgi:excisionase family DNA binding protein